MENNTKVLQSFLEEPTTYTIDVLDNSMLPEGIKEKEQLKFTIKRPTLKVLAKTALPLSRIPKEIHKKQNLTIPEISPYFHPIAEIIAIMAHGASSKPIPKWYVDFFLANLTDSELYMIYKDIAMKSDSSFFLSCIQVAEATNPMMIKSSTLTS